MTQWRILWSTGVGAGLDYLKLSMNAVTDFLEVDQAGRTGSSESSSFELSSLLLSRRAADN